MTTNQETFGNFDLPRALDYLKLFPYPKWEIPFQSIPPTDALTINLRRAERQVTTGSNEWEQRLFMELIFLEAVENHDLRMWQEKNIDAGENPFKGKVDFVFTPYQAQFKTPYVLVSEAKKDDFEQGWGQCLMALKAAALLNEQAAHEFTLYGIVSSGRVWEFCKYTSEPKFYRSDAYTMAQPEAILGILALIFEECETYVRG